MFITIHCGGMPFDGNTIKNHSLGGSESAAYYLAREFAKNGNRVTVFTNIDQPSESEGVKYVPAGPVTEQCPLGESFEYYATHTPMDVLIIQRHQQAFQRRYLSKVNLWWLHDLALVRTRLSAHSHMWNIDGILCVSEFHKQQICETWQLPREIVHVVENGIDPSLFKRTDETDDPIYSAGFNLLYSSRPERGLEHLVRPGGIMDELRERGSKATLYVCGYDNTMPHMADFYRYLWGRCDEMPNVINLGALTKAELAKVMMNVSLHVYPTEFEEVSCITAMEAMAAGLPMIASAHAALPETCRMSGALMVPLKGGRADELSFVEKIQHLEQRPAALRELSVLQKSAAKNKTWSKVVDRVYAVISGVFHSKTSNPSTMLTHLMHNSDIIAARVLVDAVPEEKRDRIFAKKVDELNECYKFVDMQSTKQHYADYYEYEKSRGVNYGPENLQGNLRFEHVSHLVASNSSPGDNVLDYGCAHGHYTVNLAKRFRDRRFVGIDICARNIDTARAWAAEEQLDNVDFILGEYTSNGLPVNCEFNLIIAAEVVEHVKDPQRLVDGLASYLHQDGLMIGTTPYGPWESAGYKTHWPWRAHLHHFERADLHDMFGKFPQFKIVNIPNNPRYGSYCWTFKKPTSPSGQIDYFRKIAQQSPRETVSLCAIVKDSAEVVLNMIKSAAQYADEFVIGVDETSKQDVLSIIQKYLADNHNEKPSVLFTIPSPMQIGFDAARNRTVEQACGDWILWIDADEILTVHQPIELFMRHNMYNGYVIPQHNYSTEPAGLLKTDMPCRMFRNRKGIKFFGRVHEHPEIEINKGLGQATRLPGADIAHLSYTTENVRIGKFERNIDLLVRDREDHPDRHLGKFLWLRDLAQMCEQELRMNGGDVTASMRKRADAGVKLWEELFEIEDPRLVVEALQFYSTLAAIRGEGFWARLNIDMNKFDAPNGQPNIITAFFDSQAHFAKLIDKLIAAQSRDLNSRYM